MSAEETDTVNDESLRLAAADVPPGEFQYEHSTPPRLLTEAQKDALIVRLRGELSLAASPAADTEVREEWGVRHSWVADGRVTVWARDLLAHRDDLLAEVTSLRVQVAAVRALCAPDPPTRNDECGNCGDRRFHHDAVLGNCSLCGFCGDFVPVARRVTADAILAALGGDPT